MNRQKIPRKPIDASKSIVVRSCLTFYNAEGDQYDFELSPVQAKATLKLLGIDMDTPTVDYFTCFDDDTVNMLIERAFRNLKYVTEDEAENIKKNLKK